MNKIFAITMSALFSQVVFAQEFVLLGVAQDAGYPQIACQKSCCTEVWKDLSLRKYPVSLAITDKDKWYLIDATPDMKYQLNLFHQVTKGKYPYMPEAILLTHAHVGHYTGLKDLGREAMNAKGLKVFASKKLKRFLTKNGPWEQLVKLGNIEIQTFNEELFNLSEGLKVLPMQVPHRDEYSDTYAFKIIGHQGSTLYIPDIDKWHLWKYDIKKVIESVNIAFVDATFYSGEEINAKRNISEIPHPFIIETLSLFEHQPLNFKNKIHFIHFNHTNPLLRDTRERAEVEKMGYHAGTQGKIYRF